MAIKYLLFTKAVVLFFFPHNDIITYQQKFSFLFVKQIYYLMLRCPRPHPRRFSTPRSIRPRSRSCSARSKNQLRATQPILFFCPTLCPFWNSIRQFINHISCKFRINVIDVNRFVFRGINFYPAIRIVFF